MSVFVDGKVCSCLCLRAGKCVDMSVNILALDDLQCRCRTLNGKSTTFQKELPRVTTSCFLSVPYVKVPWLRSPMKCSIICFDAKIVLPLCLCSTIWMKRIK